MANPTIIEAEPNKQELFITREFEAKREAVFQAFTNPDILKQWLGPKDLVMTIDYFSMVSGGKYRYYHVDEKGNEYGFNGAIHEVAFPERIIQTFEFEGMPERGHVSFEIALFEELPNNRTKVKMQSVFRSVVDRDGMVQSGMERGVTEGFEKLDTLLNN